MVRLSNCLSIWKTTLPRWFRARVIISGSGTVSRKWDKVQLFGICTDWIFSIKTESRQRKYLQLVFLAVSVFVQRYCWQNLVIRSDTGFENAQWTWSERTGEGGTTMWDIMHTTATLQGIVNRNSPRLYIRCVKNGQGECRWLLVE